MIQICHTGHYGLTDEKVTEATAILGDTESDHWIAYDIGLFADDRVTALVQAAEARHPNNNEARWRFIEWNLRLIGAYQYDRNNYRFAGSRGGLLS